MMPLTIKLRRTLGPIPETLQPGGFSERHHLNFRT
uniref:Uncharacterized protein n=1 Tax=Anguilla anguilla TaxID=7936 RepID=A0A0E9QL66_ANGAN